MCPAGSSVPFCSHTCNSIFESRTDISSYICYSRCLFRPFHLGRLDDMSNESAPQHVLLQVGRLPRDRGAGPVRTRRYPLHSRLRMQFCDWRGAKGCRSDRSRQAFSNEYLISKSGVDTALQFPFQGIGGTSATFRL